MARRTLSPYQQLNDRLFAEYSAATGAEAIRIRNRIARENVDLIRKIAWRCVGTCREEFEDLCQMGSIGCIKAIERFDPSSGNSFSSFAVPYIRGEILHFLRDHGSQVKIPRRWRELVARYKRFQSLYIRQHGKPPTDEIVEQSLGRPMADILQARNAVDCDKPDLFEEDYHDVIGYEESAWHDIEPLMEFAREKISRSSPEFLQIIEAAFFAGGPSPKNLEPQLESALLVLAA